MAFHRSCVSVISRLVMYDSTEDDARHLSSLLLSNASSSISFNISLPDHDGTFGKDVLLLRRRIVQNVVVIGGEESFVLAMAIALRMLNIVMCVFLLNE